MEIGINFTGTGCALPEATLNNEVLSHLLDTSDEWIVSHTGIRERHLAASTDSLPQLAIQAGSKALQAANLDGGNLDLIILATSTATDLFGDAGIVQAALGATKATAFDLTVGCSGFVFGLAVAAQFIRSGMYRNVLLIGADTLSRWADWSERNSCVLFGDGAGALVMQAGLPDGGDSLLAIDLFTDGSKNKILKIPSTSQKILSEDNIDLFTNQYEHLQMKGKDVYQFTSQNVPELLRHFLNKANLKIEEINWFVFHQSNQRILDIIAKKLDLPEHKVLTNIAQCGNTAAASIPILLNESIANNKIQAGDLIVTAAYGAGMNFGAAAFYWDYHVQ